MKRRMCRKYVVDLDASPRERWAQIVGDHKAAYKDIIVAMREFIGPEDESDAENDEERAEMAAASAMFNELADCLLSSLEEFGVGQYAEDLRAVASLADVSIQDMCLLHLLYEGAAGCTSILVHNAKGQALLGRTLDWNMPALRALAIEVDFMKSGKLLYTATTWAGYVGMLTAMKPGAFSVAVNFRDDPIDESSEEKNDDNKDNSEDTPHQATAQASPDTPEDEKPTDSNAQDASQASPDAQDDEANSENKPDQATSQASRDTPKDENLGDSKGHDASQASPDTQEDENLEDSKGQDASQASPDAQADTPSFSWPCAFLVRRAVEQCDTYDDLVEYLSQEPVMAPFYVAVAGVNGSGCVVTRSARTEERRQVLAPFAARSSSSPPSPKHLQGQSRSSSSQEQMRVVISSPYLVQANMDFWLTTQDLDFRDSLSRTKFLHKTLTKTLRKPASKFAGFDFDQLRRLLDHKKICDNQTVYTTMMNCDSGEIVSYVPASEGRGSQGHAGDVDATGIRGVFQRIFRFGSG